MACVGQDGTTDVTRTVHLGTPSNHEKECFTRVLKGESLCPARPSTIKNVQIWGQLHYSKNSILQAFFIIQTICPESKFC